MGELNLTAFSRCEQKIKGEIMGENSPMISPIVFVLSECVIGADVPLQSLKLSRKQAQKITFRLYFLYLYLFQPLSQ